MRRHRSTHRTGKADEKANDAEDGESTVIHSGRFHDAVLPGNDYTYDLPGYLCQ